MTKHWPSDRVGKKVGICVWKVDDVEDSAWAGDCGVLWECPSGTPVENGMNYCPRCGERLKQKGGSK